jgi:hypothetical protein
MIDRLLREARSASKIKNDDHVYDYVHDHVSSLDAFVTASALSRT